MQKPALPFVIAALVGAVVSVIVGYFAYASAHDGISFSFWIERPVRYGAIWWALTGLIVGPAARYAFR